MNFKRYIAATVALFFFIFLYEMVVHGFLLMGIYEETSTIWRPFKEMQGNMLMTMGFQLALSAWVAFAFTQIYPEGGINKGLCFGLFFGVFAGILTSMWYLWLPVPAILGLGWFGLGVGEGLGGGFLLRLIYRK